MSETHLRLRPHTEADLPNYVTWLNDPEVTEFTAIESGNITLQGEREWFAQISDPECRARNWATEADAHHIGVCSLVPDSSGQTAYFGIIIGDKAQWGKGYGTAALREVLRIGFEEMGLHRIHLQAFGGNARGIRCYEKCGFRHEGVLRQARLKRGRWVDVVQMAILREEWEAQSLVGQELASCPLMIRSYRPSDYEQVLALWQAVGFNPSARDTREALSYKLLRDPGLFLVAEVEGRPVGTAVGSWDGRWAWVYRVAVDPEMQRCGIGSQLVAEIEARLARLGARRTALISGRGNERAVAFYERLGYQMDDSVGVMWKQLDSREGSSDGPQPG